MTSILLIVFALIPCVFASCVHRDDSRERPRKKSPERGRKSWREEKEEKESKHRRKSVSSEDERPRRKQRKDSERSATTYTLVLLQLIAKSFFILSTHLHQDGIKNQDTE